MITPLGFDIVDRESIYIYVKKKKKNQVVDESIK